LTYAAGTEETPKVPAAAVAWLTKSSFRRLATQSSKPVPMPSASPAAMSCVSVGPAVSSGGWFRSRYVWKASSLPASYAHAAAAAARVAYLFFDLSSMNATGWMLSVIRFAET
jgi:hypothetical protein